MTISAKMCFVCLCYFKLPRYSVLHRIYTLMPQTLLPPFAALCCTYAHSLSISSRFQVTARSGVECGGEKRIAEKAFGGSALPFPCSQLCCNIFGETFDFWEVEVRSHLKFDLLLPPPFLSVPPPFSSIFFFFGGEKASSFFRSPWHHFQSCFFLLKGHLLSHLGFFQPVTQKFEPDFHINFVIVEKTAAHSFSTVRERSDALICPEAKGKLSPQQKRRRREEGWWF